MIDIIIHNYRLHYFMFSQINVTFFDRETQFKLHQTSTIHIIIFISDS